MHFEEGENTEWALRQSKSQCWKGERQGLEQDLAPQNPHCTNLAAGQRGKRNLAGTLLTLSTSPWQSHARPRNLPAFRHHKLDQASSSLFCCLGNLRERLQLLRESQHMLFVRVVLPHCTQRITQVLDRCQARLPCSRHLTTPEPRPAMPQIYHIESVLAS